MKYRKIFLLLVMAVSFTAYSQVESAGGVKKRSEKDSKETAAPGVSDRMQGFFQGQNTHDADLSYMKEVYRRLDLQKGPNAALYYPEDVINGQENLFRIMLRLVLDGKINAYEYLDGREIFTDQYKMSPADIISRFDIYATPAKGSTEKNPKYVIDEADVPAGQVQNYYIIEKWEFDSRSNSMKTIVEAICPVLNKYGEYGGEDRYPMFWVKFDALRPYLASQYVFVSDDNNLPRYSLDDYFNLGLYDGEIYKTRNMRNLSLAQQFPDEDDMRHAQDSIDSHLRNYGKNLWVPSRDEYLASKGKASGKKKQNTVATTEDLPERTDGTDDQATVVSEDDNSAAQPAASARSKKKTTKKKKAKVSNASSASGANPDADKSVRRRRR